MDEIWYKENTKENNRECKSYGTKDLSFKDCYWLKLILFFISQFYARRNQIVST